MTSTEEIRTQLAAGYAVLRYIKKNETWYAAGLPQPDPMVVDTWSIGVDDNDPDEGTFGEWDINFVQLGSSTAARHEIFHDALPALLAVPGYLEAMRATDGTGDERPVVEAALVALGFKDMTQRTEPRRLS